MTACSQREKGGNGMEDTGFLTGAACRKLTELGWEEVPIELAAECELTITVDGETLPTILCSPVEIMELVIGRLITGGFVRDEDEFASCEVDESEAPERIRVSVVRKENRPAPEKKPRKTADWDADMIRKLREYVITDAGKTRSGHSLHSCTLMCGGEIVCCREDISRRNVIDRVVGWAAKYGVELAGCVVFFSGRISKDAVRQAAAAGITVLCGKALPTAQAAALAEKEQIVLLHSSERRGLLQF